ncbi:MAG: ATP-binding cassette domain-containing protein [Lachnospiraceae bacterium]|nr:ATP-binding cassette domain-containing protein [Lachnospiraceae bacterium]
MPALIEVKNLKKYFKTPRGTLHAVDDVSFKIEKGKTLGVVGESGCGKSTLGRTIIHLHESTGGNIYFNGEDITRVSAAKISDLRRHLQIIFQDPYSSLDPRMTVEQTLKEALKMTKRYSGDQILVRTKELVELVGIDSRMMHSYPHELDGGRRQRVGIARALAMDPDFIVCDEPVSALDVSIQAQVLNLLSDLQDEYNLTYMFVTHDMSVVRHISDDICVMYLGQAVEMSESRELFEKPLHPYTKALLSVIPIPELNKDRKREILQGEIVSPVDPKPGCRFAARCKYATEACKQPQQLEEVLPGHYVSCCRVREINKEELGKK